MSSTIEQLMCVTANAGIPILTRHIGAEPLAFPVMGSLNGVDMFAQNHGVRIVNTRAGRAKIVWRIYKDSIKLIIISKESNMTDFQLHILMDNVFNSMVLLMGLSELEVVKNVDRLKKDLRRSTSLIDNLLRGASSFGSVTQCADIIACNSTDTSILQNNLDAFVSACGSDFGCLLVHGKIIVATEKWWQLLPSETMLLLLLLRSVPPASARDFPIYLPHGSPNIPHRLMTMEILEGIEACVICGPEPLLQHVLENHVSKYWQSVTNSLQICLRSHPRNLPSSTVLDKSIIGFILINVEEGKCLASIYPHGRMTGSEGMTNNQRREALLQFYLSVVGTAFQPEDDEVTDDPIPECKFSDEISETYVCAEQHKLYATQWDYYQVFVLFAKDTPTYALDTLTQRTFRPFKDNFI